MPSGCTGSSDPERWTERHGRDTAVSPVRAISTGYGELMGRYPALSTAQSARPPCSHRGPSRCRLAVLEIGGEVTSKGGIRLP